MGPNTQAGNNGQWRPIKIIRSWNKFMRPCEIWSVIYQNSGLAQSYINIESQSLFSEVAIDFIAQKCTLSMTGMTKAPKFPPMKMDKPTWQSQQQPQCMLQHFLLYHRFLSQLVSFFVPLHVWQICVVCCYWEQSELLLVGVFRRGGEHETPIGTSHCDCEVNVITHWVWYSPHCCSGGSIETRIVAVIWAGVCGSRFLGGHQLLWLIDLASNLLRSLTLNLGHFTLIGTYFSSHKWLKHFF